MVARKSYGKAKRSRNDVARYMLEHRDQYRVRIVYDKKVRLPKLKPTQIVIEDEDHEGS